MDDDPKIREVLVRAIESQGLGCASASNGAEALALLSSTGDVALCITDISMPEMDGLTLLQQLRARYPDIAVTMLTAVAEVTTAVEKGDWLAYMKSR